MTGTSNPEHLNLLFRAANLVQDAFLITTGQLDSPGPQIVYVNHAFSSMTGYPASEAIGKTPRFLQGAETSKEELGRLRRHLRDGRDFDGRLVNYRQDGSRFVVGLKIRPIRDAEGHVTHFFALQRDVTREEESRGHLESLEHAVRQTQDSILMFGAAEGRVHWANESYLAWAGIEREQVLGRPIWMLPGAPRSRKELGWARRQVSRGHGWQREYEVRLDSDRAELRGGNRSVATTISPVRRGDDPPSDFVVICRDVTERNRAFDIDDARRQADQMGQVFAAIRHEFGNPVNSIKSALTVLDSEADPLSTRQTQFVARILDEVARLEFHLVSLRSFGIFDRLQLERIEVRRLLERVEKLISPEMNAREIAFRVVPAPTEAYCRLDEQGALHVFAQILNNAMDAVADVERPEIHLVGRVVGRRVQLSICDNGKGMSKNELEHASLPFFTTKAKAAGLGLASVVQMVSKMRGTFAIDSVAGTGTTATLELDLADPP